MVNKVKNKFNLFHAKHIAPHHRNVKITKAVDNGVASVGLFSSFMAFPQVFKVYATQNISSFTPLTWIAALAASIGWLGYGIFYKSKPVMMTSSLSLTVNLLMLASFIIFR